MRERRELRLLYWREVPVGAILAFSGEGLIGWGARMPHGVYFKIIAFILLVP